MRSAIIFRLKAMRHLAVIACCFLLLGGCAYVPLASGGLQGTTAAPPAEWGSQGEVKIVQLETRPADPYTVNLWMVAIDSNIYVYAGGKHARWGQHIDADPNVRLRIGDNVYALRAQRVNDDEEFQKFAAGWFAKYSSDRRDDNPRDTYLYRLSAP